MSIVFRIAIVSVLGLFSNYLISQNSSEDITIQFENTHINDALLQLSEVAHIPIGFDSNLFNKENKTINQKYFATKTNTILSDILDGTGVSFKYQNDNLILYRLPVKDVIISGYIIDKNSGENLIGATIFDYKSGRGVFANSYGFFSMKIPNGKHHFRASYVGYEPRNLVINCQKNKFLKIDLEIQNTIKEILIIGTESNDMLTEKSVKNIRTKDITGIINSGGEPDVIHYLQTTTGVQSNADGLGGLNVRGGNADQNIILLDDAPIFYPSHTFGLFSIFNSDVIREIKFSKSGFNAKYGGRLSSVLDIRTKEGNTEHANFTLSTSTLATNVTVEIPVVKSKSSIFIAARRSHIDPLINYSTKTRNKNDNTGTTNYYFYDFNLKYHSAITPRDKIYISGYTGQDYFSDNTGYVDTTEIDFHQINDQNQELKWGNSLVSFRWNHIFGNKLFSNLTATHSQYRYKGHLDRFGLSVEWDSTFQDLYQSDFISKITDSNIKTDFNYYWKTHHRLNFGFGFLYRVFDTKIFQDYQALNYPNNDYSRRLKVYEPIFNPNKSSAKEFNLYIEDRIILLKDLILNIGIRNSIFNHIGYNTLSLQPRIILHWKLVPTTHLIVSFSKMTQYLHVLTSSGGGLPTDIWVPSNKTIKPKNSLQYATTIETNWNKHFTTNIGVYYKTMTGLIQYYDEAKLPFITDNDPTFWEEEVSVGNGKSYGLEVEASYKTSKIKSFVHYTYMNSTRQFEGVNGGKEFPFIYNQPHHVQLNLSWYLASYATFDIGWQWHKGTPYTEYRSSFKFNPLVNDYWFGAESEDGNEGIISSVNGARLPDYHSLSAKINLYWGHKYKHSLSLGITNIYNRKNAYFSYESVDIFDNTNKTVNKTTFSILPLFRYQIRFGD